MEEKVQVRIHSTNIVGTGAVQLFKSLIPAIESQTTHLISVLYGPEVGELAKYRLKSCRTRLVPYKRYLPNAVSRLMEVLFLSYYFQGEGPLLVLGDIPIRGIRNQVVFVQTAFLLKPKLPLNSQGSRKYLFMRFLFRLNAKYARAFIVQTELMKDRLIESYPEINGRVHVIGQPVPDWLSSSAIARKGRRPNSGKLTLIFPAANYPHKNHKLLGQISVYSAWPISKLYLTINEEFNPSPQTKFLKCIGLIGSSRLAALYNEVDALLFLSLEESYGFPLIEAMYIGIPIVCADLPYARYLCGENAIYFNPRDIHSLNFALNQLQDKLASGWWPDWEGQLKGIPQSWEVTAKKFLEVLEE